jgi:hypothetical protein
MRNCWVFGLEPACVLILKSCEVIILNKRIKVEITNRDTEPDHMNNSSLQVNYQQYSGIL